MKVICNANVTVETLFIKIWRKYGGNMAGVCLKYVEYKAFLFSVMVRCDFFSSD